MNKRNLLLLLPVLAAFILLQLNSCKHDFLEIVEPDPNPVPAVCDTSNVTFSGSVLPIFQQNCFICHSGATPQAGIDLSNYSTVEFLASNGILQGAINHLPGFSPMPQNGGKLDDCSIRKIEIWIRDTTFSEPPPAGHPCDPDTVYFEVDVFPIILSTCANAGCHDGTNEEAPSFLSYSNIIASGMVKPYDLNDSELWENINETDPEKIMPPPPNQPLNSIQKEIIRKWIMQGALDLSCDEACDTANVTFSGTIWPNIVQKHCFGCHNGPNASGGVHLENYNDISSHAAIPAGQPGSLYGAVTHAAGNVPMPRNQPQLSDCKIEQIRKWIDAGAPNN